MLKSNCFSLILEHKELPLFFCGVELYVFKYEFYVY